MRAASQTLSQIFWNVLIGVSHWNCTPSAAAAAALDSPKSTHNLYTVTLMARLDRVACVGTNIYVIVLYIYYEQHPQHPEEHIQDKQPMCDTVLLTLTE